MEKDRWSDSRQTRSYSVNSLFKIIKGQDQAKGDKLAENQGIRNELKRAISLQSKQNFTLERDIRSLDKKIALLIRDKIKLEDVLNKDKDLTVTNTTGQIKSKKHKELYGQFFWLLQHDTKYISSLARLVSLGEIDNLLQTVMFTLYGNQYDELEEHLLLSMFKSVLVTEFEKATGIGNLLRANTALTRMMTTYTRRGHGQKYLKDTLTGVLADLCAKKDLVLEVNPMKVYIEYINNYEIENGVKSDLPRSVTAEEAAANAHVKKIVAPRMKMLDTIATTFIDALIVSLDNVPYGIRWICQQIKDLVRTKFPSATRDQVCSLIGGFYLLRFINPAIVTPQAFMLVDTKLSANTRRNLTLLAKILQNLANNIKFGGLKEFYMEPLNSCLDKNKEKLNKFLLEMTKVDDLEEHLNLDRYLALAKTDESIIQISFNEIYFIHELLLKYKEEMKLESSDPILPIVKALGPAPEKLSRKDNANVELVLQDLAFGDDRTLSKDMGPEQLYTETKFLLFTIIKELPDDTLKSLEDKTVPTTVDTAYAYSKSVSDKPLGEKCKKINRNIRKLIEHGLLDDDGNFHKLRKDAFMELTDYDEQLKKIDVDITRLKEVLDNILEHQTFLEDQYEAYKAYLEDVKNKCSMAQPTGKREKKAAKKAAKAAAKAGKRDKVKYSYNQLEKDGIIKESEVPKDRRNHISFIFTSDQKGVYDVAVKWRVKHISELRLFLDDLLERQEEGNLDFETDFLTLDVNLLLHLLHKHFVIR